MGCALISFNDLFTFLNSKNGFKNEKIVECNAKSGIKNEKVVEITDRNAIFLRREKWLQNEVLEGKVA